MDKDNKLIIEKKKFKKDGKYEIIIIFNNDINNLKGIFQEGITLFSIDLSNFDTSKVNDMG